MLPCHLREDKAPCPALKPGLVKKMFFKVLWCGSFLKSLLKLLWYHFFFMFWAFFWPWGTRDRSSPSRDWIHTPCLGRQSPEHWTTWEVPWDNCGWRLKSKRKEGRRDVGGPENEVQNSRGGVRPGRAPVQVREGANILKILGGGGKCFHCCSRSRVCILASLPFMVELTGCWARREAAGPWLQQSLQCVCQGGDRAWCLRSWENLAMQE